MLQLTEVVACHSSGGIKSQIAPAEQRITTAILIFLKFSTFFFIFPSPYLMVYVVWSWLPSNCSSWNHWLSLFTVCRDTYSNYIMLILIQTRFLRAIVQLLRCVPGAVLWLEAATRIWFAVTNYWCVYKHLIQNMAKLCVNSLPHERGNNSYSSCHNLM